MDTTMDTLVINIQSTTDSATQSIGKLISSLKKLQTELDNTISTSKGLSSIKNIGDNIKTTSGKKTTSSSTTSPATSLGVNEQLKNLGVDLKGWQETSVFKNLNTETTKYKNNMGQVVTITKKAKNGIDSYNVSLRTTAQTTNKFNNNSKNMGDILSSAKLKFSAMIGSAIILKNKLEKLVELAGAEAEALNLFTVTMGSYAKQGIKWVEEFSSALYLDPVAVQQYMGSFNSLVKGLGVGAENSYKMSQNLTQLVYDLSSFKNISIESAYEKLMSGISGELEPLRNVGVAMSEATLQTLAYELGIEKLVRNMTEAEKAQLRYIQIMRSSKEWQTDMGRTLIQPANALRVMRQQFTLLGRAIGKVFIPIVMELMPYVIAMTELLTSLATKLAHMFGYEIQDIDYSGLENVSAGITDIGNSADETKNKLNTMLAPFDDLNVVQNKAKDTGSGLSGFGGDLGIDLPEYDALANLNEKFADGVERAKKNLKGMLPIVIAIGGAFAAWKITGAVSGLLAFFGIGKKGKEAAEGAKATKSILPTWKTLLKGMAQLAVVVGGAVLFVEALGLLTRIPGFKENITTGIDALVDTFWGIAKIAVPLAGFTAATVLLGSVSSIKTMAIGLANLAIVIGGLEVAVVAIGALMSIPFVNTALNTGIKAVKDLFNGLSEVALPLAGFTVALGLLGLTGGGGAAAILVGLGLFAEVVVGLQLVLAAIGGLYQIPGFDWIIGEGGKALSQIGSILGDFGGSLVEAFASKSFESIPKLGTELSQFIKNAKPFFDGITGIDKDSTQGVKNIAECILLLTENNIIKGLTGWFAGSTSLETFGEELNAFAPNFAKFTNSIANISDDNLAKAPKVASALASIIEVSKDIPNQGKSVVSFFVGDNKLSTFGKELSKFAPKFASYIKDIASVDSQGLTKSDKVFTALAKIIEVSKDIPNQGVSVVSFFVGDNKLSTFGEELSKFAPKFVSYYTQIKTVGDNVEDKTTKVFNSVKTINDIDIDKKGGLFSGTVTLSKFGEDIKSFGASFKSYYSSIKDIKVDTVNNITKALSTLVTNYKTIKDNKLTDTVKSFGTALQNSAKNIKSYFSTELSYSSGWSIGNSFGAGIGDAVKSAMKSRIGTTIKVKDGYETLKSFTISAYAQGGYPTSGELFFANENGVPEMIGRIGNQTAVANNDQIATSLTNALLSALNQYDFGGGKSPTTIYIGNRKVYEGYGDYVADENDRYGTNMIKI